jgi:signal transduction histidine kinase
MSPSARRAPEGIGLRNVRERQAVQFGDRATFDSGALDATHWRATIRMPLLRDAPAARSGVA